MINGTSLLQGYVPDADATVVTRILDAGGTILGKSVCESFASPAAAIPRRLDRCAPRTIARARRVDPPAARWLRQAKSTWRSAVIRADRFAFQVPVRNLRNQTDLWVGSVHRCVSD
jgi:amidase